MTNSLLSRVVKKQGSACLHSTLTCRGPRLYRTTVKDNNAKPLNIRYSEYERKRKQLIERERG